MTIGDCKICGKPAKGLKGKAAYCSAECVRQNERDKNAQHQATFSRERKIAHRLTATSILNGTLKRCSCEACGTRAADAHHDDYAKPLDIRWLCRSCHKLHHNQFGPGKNAFIAETTSA